MVFGREMDTLCRPSTFEHVLAAIYFFARTSDVSLDDGALLNCRTAPKSLDMLFGLRWFLHASVRRQANWHVLGDG